jgi:hypothetical protein
MPFGVNLWKKVYFFQAINNSHITPEGFPPVVIRLLVSRGLASGGFQFNKNNNASWQRHDPIRDRPTAGACKFFT